jgi:hypothetical protein
MATSALEIFEQLGAVPGSVVMPVGQGTLLIGVWRGFQALQAAGVAGPLPQLIGVQARACAPIWAVQHSGSAGLGWIQEGETLAEGYGSCSRCGVTWCCSRGDRRLDGGCGWSEIRAAGQFGLQWSQRRTDVCCGLAALRNGAAPAEPVVAVLTGSGYKHAADLRTRPEAPGAWGRRRVWNGEERMKPRVVITGMERSAIGLTVAETWRNALEGVEASPRSRCSFDRPERPYRRRVKNFQPSNTWRPRGSAPRPFRAVGYRRERPWCDPGLRSTTATPTRRRHRFLRRRQSADDPGYDVDHREEGRAG